MGDDSVDEALLALVVQSNQLDHLQHPGTGGRHCRPAGGDAAVAGSKEPDVFLDIGRICGHIFLGQPVVALPQAQHEGLFHRFIC